MPSNRIPVQLYSILSIFALVLLPQNSCQASDADVLLDLLKYVISNYGNFMFRS
jgi:hypothetical protein